MRHFLPALLFVLALSGCGATSLEDAQEELDAYARKSRLSYYRRLTEPDPARGLRIVCSRGQRCDSSGPHVWEYQDEAVWFQLEYRPGASPAEYRASWSVGPLEGLDVPGWRFTAVGTEVPELWTHTSDPPKLGGRLDTVATVIHGLKDDPEACSDEDPDDQNWPRGCFINASSEVEVRLDILLAFEEGVVDCRGEAPPERCR